MLRRRLPVPKFNWSMSPRRAALGVGLFIILGALSAALVLLSDGRTQLTQAAPANEQMLLLCANGTVVPDAANQPGLVADCAALLEARDALRGTATLNWSAERAITSWTGVTVETVSSAEGKRVTALDLDSRRLDGVIPASLGRLSALRNLRLGFNRLTGTIPVELGRLTSLRLLLLNGNHLSGTIPVELAEIGGTLTSLQLAGPNPLPEGVGLSGTIPPQLGNLTGLRNLNLSSNRLSGPIPARLGLLVNLRWLTLNRNQLSGSIPTHLGQLRELTNLRLDDNQLSGVIPSQFGNFTRLRKVYLKRNTGFTGCAPSRLRDVRFTDFSSLNLPECADDAPATTATPEPTYTLTVTAGEDGAVSPSGTTTHAEAVEVTLTASWNDATHTFAGWSGACSGSETTCTLEMYADAVVAAAFTPLPADRCATATDADCIRAVYLGAPDDYAQVQDIPTDLLLSPDADGRYQVERGQQYTVVTAAPLPEGWTRFYLERSPVGEPRAVSLEQLIRPVGTTFTFTVSEDERAATLITFDLTAARPLPIQRPGIKPELGETLVTSRFRLESSTLRYGSYDASGAVTAPGNYAFLSDPDDTATAVTTYESLRDGTTGGLLIHETDGFGASQSQLYDAIAVGDLFEWRRADDCFVRYTVTEVKPDPVDAAPRKLLALEWMTYAFTGCSGSIAADADVWFRWGELADLGGADLSVPVVHGPFQIVPEDWSGAVQEPLTRTPVGYSHNDPRGGRDIAVARTLPFWRDPVLPEGMLFLWASSGDQADPVHGYQARFEGGGSGIAVYAHDISYSRHPKVASWRNGRGIRETRIIADRPALVIYSPQGPSHADLFPVTVWVYDPENEALYEILGLYGGLLGSNVAPVIAIARSLFEPEAQP